MVRDVGLAEDLAHDALVAALEQWPASGIPNNAGAWLMAAAKHRAIDHFRRAKMLDRKHEELGQDLEERQQAFALELEAALDDDVGDDLLRLMFTACHPVLSAEARAAMTLRLLGRPDDRRNRARVSRPRAHHRPAHRPRQAHACQGARAVRGSARRRSRCSIVVGARSDLPHLQRGLFRDRRRRLDAPRALPGCAPPRPHSRRARATGSRGARPRRADGNSGLARGRSGGFVGRAGVAPRSGSLALGSAADPPRPRCARARREARRRARTVCAAGRDRGLPRASARAVGNRLGAHRRALCRACASDAVAHRRVESRGRGGDGARSGSGTRDCRFAPGRALAQELSPSPERARRSSVQARTSATRPAPSSSAQRR